MPNLDRIDGTMIQDTDGQTFSNKLGIFSGSYYYVDSLGAKGDGLTDDSDIIAQAITQNPTKEIRFRRDKTYVVKKLKTIQLLSNTRVNGQGCTILVPSDATIVDTVGNSDSYYNNAVFYIPVGQQSNIIIENINFNINVSKGTAVLCGDMTTPLGDGTRKNIRVLNCTMNGNQLLYTSFVLANGTELYVSGCRVNDAFTGIDGSENSGWIVDNYFEYIGVSRDLNTWQNSTAIRMSGFRNGEIKGNTLKYVGGTALSVTAPASSTYDCIIDKNIIIGAGLAGIGAGNKDGGGYIKRVKITNNKIIGYLCSNDVAANLHPAIACNTGTTVLAQVTDTSNDFQIIGNEIDFIAPHESWDATNKTVTGSKNSMKSYNVALAGAEAISVRYADIEQAYNVQVHNNIINNVKTRAIHAGNARNVSIKGNLIYNNGWERDASNHVLDTNGNSAIRAENIAGLIVEGNIINECGLGLDGTNGGSSVLYIYKCTGYIINQNTYLSTTSGHNKAFIGLFGGDTSGEYFAKFSLGASIKFKGTIGHNPMIAGTTPFMDSHKSFTFNLEYTYSGDLITDANGGNHTLPLYGVAGDAYMKTAYAIGVSSTTTPSRNLGKPNIAVGAGVTSLFINFATNESDANYIISVSPSWSTNWWVVPAEKTISGFTVHFGTAPGSAQTLDWMLLR